MNNTQDAIHNVAIYDCPECKHVDVVSDAHFWMEPDTIIHTCNDCGHVLSIYGADARMIIMNERPNWRPTEPKHWIGLLELYGMGFEGRVVDMEANDTT